MNGRGILYDCPTRFFLSVVGINLIVVGFPYCRLINERHICMYYFRNMARVLNVATVRMLRLIDWREEFVEKFNNAFYRISSPFCK